MPRERLIQKLPHLFAEKVVWGSRYPNQDTTTAWEAIETLRNSNIDDATIARMMGGNAAQQYRLHIRQTVGA